VADARNDSYYQVNMADDMHVEKKRFTLIFPSLEAVHLHKDVGQIPYQMQKHFAYRSEIVCYQHRGGYSYLDAELKGLELKFIKASPLSYLLANARKIDVLMLFHVKTETMYATLLYKLLNPKGVVYVKYDGIDHELSYAAWGKRNFITQLKRNLLFKLFLRKLDLFSVECRQVYDRLSRIPAEKKMLLANGFDPEIPAYFGVTPRPFAEKENIILLVGRHGSEVKNSEFVLSVLEGMGDLGDWQVFFIGPMTREFEQLKDRFLQQNAKLREKVHFTGTISDKKILFDYYNRAKIFCLPSRGESWGMVCVESLYFGNVLVMSQELIPSYDLTDDGRVGFRLNGSDRGAWGSTLTKLMNDTDLLAQYSLRASEHFREKFVWQNILKGLHSRISEKLTV
jgi:glycosyltransferase involved in cell wall biosynthesis